MDRQAINDYIQWNLNFLQFWKQFIVVVCVTEHHDSAMKCCASKAFTFVSVANMKQLVVISHRNTLYFKLLVVIMLEWPDYSLVKCLGEEMQLSSCIGNLCLRDEQVVDEKQGLSVLAFKTKTKLRPWLLVRTRTIPTEQSLLVGEVSAKFCG
jgi:hypothetical protein